jgi:hypothetical protein
MRLKVNLEHLAENRRTHHLEHGTRRSHPSAGDSLSRVDVVALIVSSAAASAVVAMARAAVRSACKFARNSDPLRGGFRVQSWL